VPLHLQVVVVGPVLQDLMVVLPLQDLPQDL
jgi:hypothetical protein